MPEHTAQNRHDANGNQLLPSSRDPKVALRVAGGCHLVVTLQRAAANLIGVELSRTNIREYRIITWRPAFSDQHRSILEFALTPVNVPAVRNVCCKSISGVVARSDGTTALGTSHICGDGKTHGPKYVTASGSGGNDLKWLGDGDG
eukprot:scaffold251205_cov38-Prasinocladus_malaysianus.AAC.1